MYEEFTPVHTEKSGSKFCPFWGLHIGPIPFGSRLYLRPGLDYFYPLKILSPVRNFTTFLGLELLNNVFFVLTQ